MARGGSGAPVSYGSVYVVGCGHIGPRRSRMRDRTITSLKPRLSENSHTSTNGTSSRPPAPPFVNRSFARLMTRISSFRVIGIPAFRAHLEHLPSKGARPDQIPGETHRRHQDEAEEVRPARPSER